MIETIAEAGLTCSTLLDESFHGSRGHHQATKVVHDDPLARPFVQEQKLCSPCYNVLHEHETHEGKLNRPG